MIELLNHSDQLLFLQSLPHLLPHPLEVIQRNLAAVVDIEQLECFQGLFDGVSFSILPFHYVQVILIVDSPSLIYIKLSSQVHHFGFLDVKAKGSKNDLQLVICDMRCFVRIEQIEGLPHLSLLL